MDNLERLKLVLDYIADHEAEDFEENPSTNHVYYHMMCVVFGEVYAQNAYLQELEDLNKQALEEINK